MTRLCSIFVGVAALTAATVNSSVVHAQATQQLQGRVVQAGTDQFIMDANGQRVTVFVNPQTRFLQDNRAVRIGDLRVGTNVTAAYVMDGDRYLANTVTLLPAAAPAPGAQPEPPAQAPPPPPAPPAAQNPDGTLVEGQVVRVVGQDQVIIKTGDGKEVNVYVNPQTSYRFND